MDDKKYEELTSFIGGQFNEVWKRFDGVDQRFDGIDDKFEIMDKRIDGLDKKFEFKFEDLKKDFRQLQNAVDAYAAKADTYFMEMAALGNKLDRHERWISQIAEKVGIKLSS